MTDSLTAGAISAAGYTQPAAAVRAIESGADMVPIAVTTWQPTVEALEAAISSGGLSTSEVDGAAAKILLAKGLSVCP